MVMRSFRAMPVTVLAVVVPDFIGTADEIASYLMELECGRKCD